MLLIFLDSDGIMHYAKTTQTGDELILGCSDEMLEDWNTAGPVDIIKSAKKLIDNLIDERNDTYTGDQ